MPDRTEPPIDEPSLRYLAVLRDVSSTADDRRTACDGLLELRQGWWGSGSLVRFVSVMALAQAKLLTRSFRRAADALDWEMAADDALMELFGKAEHITESPRAWLFGVVRNKLRRQMHKRKHELRSESLKASIQQPEDTETRSRGPIASRILRRRVRDALQELPPSLKEVGELMLLQNKKPEDVREILGLRAPTLRKRVQRMRELMQQKIKN